MEKNNFNVTILFARKKILMEFCCVVQKGCNISELLSQYSSTIDTFVKLDKDKFQFGVYGKKKEPDYMLKKGDRIEIYESLRLDPIIRRQIILNSKNHINYK